MPRVALNRSSGWEDMGQYSATIFNIMGDGAASECCPAVSQSECGLFRFDANHRQWDETQKTSGSYRAISLLFFD